MFKYKRYLKYLNNISKIIYIKSSREKAISDAFQDHGVKVRWRILFSHHLMVTSGQLYNLDMRGLQNNPSRDWVAVVLMYRKPTTIIYTLIFNVAL